MPDAGIGETAAIGAVAAPVIGGLIGNQQAGAARNDANNARNNALAQFAGITPPDIQKMMLNPEQFTSAGSLSPEAIQSILQGDSSLSGVSTDPRLQKSQMDALNQVAGVANTGMSSADQAAYELARRNAQASAQAKQGQILQNMQQRGQAGSGAELLANLTNAQSAADQEQQAALQAAKDRQTARMQALQQQSQIATNLRGENYGEQANLANARDAIAKFNAQNSQNVNTLNTQTKNQAQQSNLQNNQNIRNSNTQLNNTAQQYNKGLNQQDFNNQLQLAGAKAGQYGNIASSRDTQAGQQAGMWAGIGQGIGTVGAGLLKAPKAADTTGE